MVIEGKKPIVATEKSGAGDFYEPVFEHITHGQYQKALDIITNVERKVPLKLMPRLMVLWGMLITLADESNTVNTEFKVNARHKFDVFINKIEILQTDTDDEVTTEIENSILQLDEVVSQSVVMIKNFRKMEKKLLARQDERDALIKKQYLFYFISFLLICTLVFFNMFNFK